MTTYIMNEIKVNEHILDDDKYLFIFSVEEVNRLAREGMPFRDAYKRWDWTLKPENLLTTSKYIIRMKEVSAIFAMTQSPH